MGCRGVYDGEERGMGGGWPGRIAAGWPQVKKKHTHNADSKTSKRLPASMESGWVGMGETDPGMDVSPAAK